MTGTEEITPSEVRRSGITSHSIGVPELSVLLKSLDADTGPEEYRRAIVEDNLLGLATENGRVWRFKTLRRLYLLRPDSILFRGLRDLWSADPAAGPLLACLCALATDTTFRSTAPVIVDASPGDEVTTHDLAGAIEQTYPDAYAPSTLEKAAANAYASWQQTGHLSPAERGRKIRVQAGCHPANVAYALLLGHLEGHRGEALFDTLWASVLDQPRSQLLDLAFVASQRGMLEFRSAGGVVEVGFRELLRPMEGKLL